MDAESPQEVHELNIVRGKLTALIDEWQSLDDVECVAVLKQCSNLLEYPTKRLDTEAEHRVILHYGGDGPVEVDVWNEHTETATHVHTDYPADTKESVDITDALAAALPASSLVGDVE